MDSKKLIDQFERYKFAFPRQREVIEFSNHVWPQVMQRLREGKEDQARGVLQEALVAAIEAAKEDRLW